MTPDELLLQAIAAGLTVALDGNRIAIRPKGQITDELRAAIVEQREGILEALRARGTMPAILASTPPRACNDCEPLHVEGVHCLHYNVTLPEPARLVRCVAFRERQPALPWENDA